SEDAFRSLYEAGVEMRNSPLLGNSRPASEAARTSLSEFSGPRSSRPFVAEETRDKDGKPGMEPAELRQDGPGRPKMPARNTAYLGRSLFSDYLLPVELAGMLLLVATIGAIAIAQRRSPSATPGLPAVLGTSPSQERTT